MRRNRSGKMETGRANQNACRMKRAKELQLMAERKAPRTTPSVQHLQVHGKVGQEMACSMSPIMKPLRWEQAESRQGGG